MVLVQQFVLSLGSCLELLSQLRDLLEEIANETDISDLEDGCIGILVDGSNNFTILHTSQMLDSATDTSTEVKLRSDVLSSLTDLQTVVCETAVDSCARSTNSGTESVGERRHDAVEFVLGLESTATGDNLLSGSEVRTV